MAATQAIQPVLDSLPTKPGCYLMKSADGHVIYVGKAINLRNRVRSYFHSSAGLSPKTAELVSRVADIEWILVSSELEALILEMNLIKRHRPKYNIRLKDDKRYPYVKVHWADPFPKVTVTRRMQNDGGKYFGPYTSVWAVHQTLDVLRRIFPYLTCDRVITGQDPRACLYHDIHLCLAPCIGAVDQAGYRQMIADLCRFLEGHTQPVVDRMKAEMTLASEEMRYERAAALRDQLAAIDRVVEGQKVVSQERVDTDVIAFARDKDDACVQVFFIRGGKLIGREYFVVEGTLQAEDREVVEGFVKQFYTQAAYVPDRVLLPTEIEEARIIEAWLDQRRGGQKMRLIVPHRGQKKELIAMAAENAAETLAMLRTRWEADRSKHVEALAELQQALSLPQPPNRIECYDISNLQGTAAAGSMVVFEQGAPAKPAYRKFTIKSVHGQDDFDVRVSVHNFLERTQRVLERLSKALPPMGRYTDHAVIVIVDFRKDFMRKLVFIADNHSQGVDYRVSGDKYVIVLYSLPEQILFRAGCRCEMQIGHGANQAPIHLFREGIVFIAGSQTRFDMAHHNPAMIGRQRRRESRGSVALNQHDIRLDLL